MDAKEKDQLLDAILSPDTQREHLPDTPAAARAWKLMRESVSRSMPAAPAEGVWQRYVDMPRETPRPQGRLLKSSLKFLIPSVAAAAAALIFAVNLPGLLVRTSTGIMSRLPVSLNYGGALDVHTKSAVNYHAQGETDTLRISADAIDARMDFRANAQMRSVLIVTPAATYRIVGTSIAVKSAGEHSALYVAEGKVSVETRGQTRLVSAGQVWAFEAGRELRRAETAVDRQAFKEYKLSAMAVVEPVKTQPGPLHEKSAGRAKAAEPLPSQEPAAIDLANPATAKEKAEIREQRDEREAARAERQRIRAEREAVRAEREARRQERQAAKADRRK